MVFTLAEPTKANTKKELKNRVRVGQEDSAEEYNYIDELYAIYGKYGAIFVVFSVIYCLLVFSVPIYVMVSTGNT